MRCSFCGNEVVLRQTSFYPRSEPREPIAAKPLFARRGVYVGVLLVGALAGALVWASLKEGNPSQKSVPRAPKWASAGAWALDINGDGYEEFVGVRYETKAGALHYTLAAYSELRDELVWETQPFSSLAGATFVLGPDAIWMGVRPASLREYDRATGALRREFKTADAVKAMCLSADETVLRVQLVDGARLRLSGQELVQDAETQGSCPTAAGACPADAQGECYTWAPGTSSPQASHPFVKDPSQCLAMTLDERMKATACEPAAPTGMRPEYIVTSGDYAVAVGAKSPGTPLPMIAVQTDSGASYQRVVNDDASKQPAPDWSPALARSYGQVALGTYYGVLPLAGGTELVAIDLETGKTIYSVTIPNSAQRRPGGLRITEARVYVQHERGPVHRFERTSGDYLGIVGLGSER